MYGGRAMLLTNARVIDGTGRAPFERASVRVADGRIVEVGELLLEDSALDVQGAARSCRG